MKNKKALLFIAIVSWGAVGCASAATRVSGGATAQPILIATMQSDEYWRDAGATVEAQRQEADLKQQEVAALAYELSATAGAATFIAQQAQAQATATAAWAQTASALELAIKTDAATAQAVSAAAQQARQDAEATSAAGVTATAVSIEVTRQMYDLRRVEAQVEREQIWGMVGRAALTTVLALLALVFVYAAWKLVPIAINRINRPPIVRYGQHNNPLIVATHDGRTSVVDPMRMLQPVLQVDANGINAPVAGSEQYQLLLVERLMSLLAEQVGHAPGHPQIEEVSQSTRQAGGVQTATTNTKRYAPPAVTRVPQPSLLTGTTAAGVQAGGAAMPYAHSPILLPNQQPALTAPVAGAPVLPASTAGAPALTMGAPITGVPAQPTLQPAPSAIVALIESQLARNEIFLGNDEEDAPVTLPIMQLWHVAIAGPTGGGKSTLLRFLLTQILASGARVALVDPHYANVDVKSGDNWAIISQRLCRRPAYRNKDMRDTLQWVVSELDERLQMRREQRVWDSPLFLAFDEYPLIVKHLPDAPEMIERILLEGRKCDIYVLNSLQGMLLNLIGGSSTARESYRTGFYLGGDAHAGRILLDQRGQQWDETHLGRGVALLRAGNRPVQEVKIPRLSNEDIAALLPPPGGTLPAAGSGSVIGVARQQPTLPGMPAASVARAPEAFLQETETLPPRPEVTGGSTAEALPPRPEVTGGSTAEALPPRPEVTGGSTAEALPPRPEVTGGSTHNVRDRIVSLLAEGVSQSEIIRRVFNVTGGRKYGLAAAVVKRIQEGEEENDPG